MNAGTAPVDKVGSVPGAVRRCICLSVCRDLVGSPGSKALDTSFCILPAMESLRWPFLGIELWRLGLWRTQ